LATLNKTVDGVYLV